MFFSEFTEKWVIFWTSLAGLYLTKKFFKYEIGACNYDVVYWEAKFISGLTFQGRTYPRVILILGQKLS